MAEDIAPELLKKIQNRFRKNIKNDKEIQRLYDVLRKGKATYNEADKLAVQVGQALADAFHRNISSDILPEGKMYYNIASRIIPPELKENYDQIADYAQTMQKGMNERAKLGMKALKPKYNQNREKGLIEYVCQADQYDDIRKSFEEDIINFDQAVVTDTLKENAEFQYESGLSPVIVRTASAGCCAWCAALAGIYPYENVRDTGNEVYQRHRDCRCDVTFDPGDGKVQNVHTKEWTALTEDGTINKKTRRDGAERAAKYSGGWPSGSMKDAINRFTPDGIEVTQYDSGKILHISKDGRYEVVEDIYGGYFRILDNSISGKWRRRKYVDLNGNDMNNVTEGGKTRGRSKDEYQRLTHFKNTDR